MSSVVLPHGSKYLGDEGRRCTLLAGVALASPGSIKAAGFVNCRLFSMTDIEWIGFWTPNLGTACPENQALNDEQTNATTFGDLILAMVAARASRAVVMLRGWPDRSIRCLEGGSVAQDTLEALRVDYSNFQRLKKVASTGNKRAEVLAKRSLFNTMPVMQLALACESSPTGSFMMWPAFMAWLPQKHRRQVGSLICESAFNLQKNANCIKGKRRYMRPDKATDICLTEKARQPHIATTASV